MNRRAFVRNSATAAALGVAGHATTMLGEDKPACPLPFPHVEGLTKYVAEFIINTKYENIPREVVELGKKDILDGFGLALSGSVGETGPLVHKYLEQGGFQPGGATVAGTAMKVPPSDMPSNIRPAWMAIQRPALCGPLCPASAYCATQVATSDMTINKLPTTVAFRITPPGVCASKRSSNVLAGENSQPSLIRAENREMARTFLGVGLARDQNGLRDKVWTVHRELRP